ncbi:metal-dependent transcriptional regulator [Agromyces indicus]|uniref:Metal-dependent transcriptional regulator n=1 Tax=Agromyces indicus TaxID=758919 RepID=A0ABU1FKU2_9MICO|nr:metal-dependent transcriptional regulator [Agromyces indicus]MDR5692380.1 metal-dependent transcriptional regulator [Agromyces indicus]
MTDLIDTTEMYLRTILDLEEEHIVPLRARISERLGHSGPTVSQTVARMERDGLVVVSGDRHLELTEAGRSKAVHVMRKHRLAERLLADVIGLDWEYVHDEACRWEHVMSEQVERRLVEILGNPTHSPYGNPIPGLEELGVEPAAPFMSGVRNVLTALDEGSGHATGVIRRLAEPAQFDPDLLARFKGAGILPGAVVEFRREGDLVVAEAAGHDALPMPVGMAGHLFIGDAAAAPEAPDAGSARAELPGAAPRVVSGTALEHG